MCRGDSPFCEWKYKEREKKQISFRSKSVVLAPWSSYTTLSDKKKTKAVTGAVPFQKIHFCT